MWETLFQFSSELVTDTLIELSSPLRLLVRYVGDVYLQFLSKQIQLSSPAMHQYHAACDQIERCHRRHGKLEPILKSWKV